MDKLLGFSQEYINLPSTEYSASLKKQAETHRRESRSRWIIVFSVVTSIFFAGLSTWLAVELHAVREYGSFAKGFHTELKTARHLLEVEQVNFTGSPHFWEDGTEYVPEPEDGIKRPQYTGNPSRAIDHEWALYHWGRFFLLSEEEARDAWGPGYQEYWSPKQGGYIAALEVMHTIHCLDHIRKAFYPDIYPPDSPIHGILHRAFKLTLPPDHCINHLRQIILCQADLTPIPSRFYIGIDQNYIDSDRPHTCRNFGKIRDWVSERFNGSLEVPPVPGTVVGDEWKNLNGAE